MDTTKNGKIFSGTKEVVENLKFDNTQMIEDKGFL